MRLYVVEEAFVPVVFEDLLIDVHEVRDSCPASI